MDRQNASIKKLNSIYDYSLIIARPTGTLGYHAQNSRTMTKYIHRQAFHPSSLITDDILIKEQVFLKKQKASLPRNSHRPWKPYGKKPHPLYDLLQNK